MECVWDPELLERGQQLPEELLQVIQHGSNEQYLEHMTKASLDARYTYTLFSQCENMFPHICARLRSHGSIAASIATLGRIISSAPYLTVYAERLLEGETYNFRTRNGADDHLEYLLGVFRLLLYDWRTFRKHVQVAEISNLLESPNRAVVYLAIRILQIYLHGADQWFESTLHKYLGKDTVESGIDGQWDDITIDYRFLALWEQERHERVSKLVKEARLVDHRMGDGHRRVIPANCFDRSVAVIGGSLMPRDIANSSKSMIDGTELIETPTVSQSLADIASALKEPQPLLLTGIAGAGKTLLVRHVARKLGKLDKMVTLHLNEQSDAKLLIGIYTTGETPGSFVWKAGVLTTAVQEGRWVVIEDLDRAPNDLVGTLLPLIERGELLIPSRKQTIHAAEGFRIIATVRSTIDHRGQQTKPLTHMIGARLWQRVSIVMLPFEDLRRVLSELFPQLSALLPQFMSVYERIQASRQRAAMTGQSKTGVLREISPRDLLKWCNRVARLVHNRATFTSNDIDDIFLEAMDCFLGAQPDGQVKGSVSAAIAEELHIDPQRKDYLLSDRDAPYQVDKERNNVGRYSLARSSRAPKATAARASFSTNPHTSRMLERVAAATINREPLLLVGETGVGKTTAVQHLAGQLGKQLVPFNLSQQSEASDLLGGFKPISARTLIVPMEDEFDDLFSASFSMSKNRDYLELLGKQMSKANWKAVCKLWHRALAMVEQQRSAAAPAEAPNKKRKVEAKRTIDFARWDTFGVKVENLEKRLSAGGDAFAFSFVEGTIIKAVRNGDWVLLDEINLASTDTLESIADLLDPTSPSILLTEAGSIERIDAHPEFRVFAAMNPATDVGKKDLPPGIRSRFTELYVESPDKDLRSLQSIVRSYLRQETASDQAIPLDVSTLYQKIIGLAAQNRLVDGANQKPHFSLRTLTRTLSYAKYIAPSCSLRRALYEGFQMSFLTFLDLESSRSLQPLLEQHLLGKRINVKAELQKALRKPNDGFEHVQGWPGSKHWVCKGPRQLEDQPHYILTPFIRTNVENLVRAASTRQSPVLIQGPTSSGKTSMIEYLAKRTGHQFVRINNHEHTDLQEYLGTYVSGIDGKLQFQEGVLVKALREGHWIVLDELNLAPTDVLEALNRLLDDNRELLIPETQETVRPHASFMLFATQNAAGLYGGRKTLSRAFRNRFLELHFDDIPVDELQEILHRRTQLPESRCKRIVTVYKELSLLRQEGRLFEQKSFATLRDLFRWASRPNDTIEQLAANGFMLLAERVRKSEERKLLKELIEKALSANGPRVIIDENALYHRDCKEIVEHQQNVTSLDVVWTKAMRRLYVLVSRAIANNEPVLLVGETGCGKTTVCQMLAHALGKELHTVNAHQNTETGDLTGSQRPIRKRAAIEARLRDQLHASSLLGHVEVQAQSTESVLQAYQQAFDALSTEQQESHRQSAEYSEIQSARIRCRALFEWTDGSLVQAMKTGAFFLLDEISLADDSVLERINSVLESQRSILLAEKGSFDSFVTAASGFQFFATMNPGGDYGKRELSPALRNRFTEIWVPSLDDDEDILQIVGSKLAAKANHCANAIVSFAQWFKERFNTSASSSISIRDVLAWVNFVNASDGTDVPSAVVHGAAMVYMDTLGANPAGLMTMTNYSLDEERRACLDRLSSVLQADAHTIYNAPVAVQIANNHFSAGSFTIASRSASASIDSGFSFEPVTTKVNTMRIVRALQLSKPVLLEGNPGVGKTALVTAIAKAVSVPLTRINLSEQIDLIDLFGSDVPVQGAETGSFVWKDAPFLRAMKNGEWVLLDEMNLATQSVLEGLNACLDHRGEVFVPELGQTFTRHPDFRLFAAQNPHHQGGGRKGLPASFVNRFTVVYADAFMSDDLTLICQRRYPSVDKALIDKAVQFVSELEHEVTQRKRVGSNGSPWEFNLRDVSRWLSLASSNEGLVGAGSARDLVDFLFSQRFRSPSDKAFVSNMFERIFEMPLPRVDLFPSISPQALQLGIGFLPRNQDEATPPMSSNLNGKDTRHLRVLESLMLCIQQSWPVVLTGSSGSGKTSMIERLASTVGASLVTIAINAETDAMDLVGGYEQSDPLRQTTQTLEELRQHLFAGARRASRSQDHHAVQQLMHTLQQLELIDVADSQALQLLSENLAPILSADTRRLADSIHTIPANIDKARFDWSDGLLVDALQEGKWLVLDNANLCSSSVLDRLNSLLEPDGCLIVNEHSTDEGAARIVRPHPNFRIFLTLDPRFGELSRAMRNRAVELYLPHESDMARTLQFNPLFGESAIARLQSFKALASESTDVPEQALSLVIKDHLAISDRRLFSRFVNQLKIGLYDGRVPSPLTGSLPADAMIENVDRLYQATIGRMQVPADFASVQTLHPLNNQPYICAPHSTEHTPPLSQALSVAVHFDLCISLDVMSQALSAMESDPSLVGKLRRLERSFNIARSQDRRASKDSALLTMMRDVITQLYTFARASPFITATEQRLARLSLNQLCVWWNILCEALRYKHVDQASITTLFAIEHNVLQGLSAAETPVLAAVLPQLLGAINLLSDSHSTRGLALSTLWRDLPPWTPPDMKQLKQLLDFELLTDEIDRMCATMSLGEAAKLRVSLAQALRLIRQGGQDILSLSEKIHYLKQPETSESSAATIDDPPHFVSVFKRLVERLDSIGDTRLRLEAPAVVELEVLARRPTKESRLARVERCVPQATGQQAILHQDNEHTRSITHCLATTEQVPLAQLETLTTETHVLGKVLSSQADLLCSSELSSLDECLRNFALKLFTALSNSDDESIRALGQSMLASVSGNHFSDLARATKQLTDLTGLLSLPIRLLGNTSKHLCSPLLPGADHVGSAALAWYSIAIASLELYIPSTASDPSLEPRLKLQIHRGQRKDISNKLDALRSLRSTLLGEADGLRARVLQECITALGQEPEVPLVCRPDISQLNQMQSEFDTLMRTMETIKQDLYHNRHLRPLDTTVVANILNIRARLQDQYRAYDDFTAPAIEFVDCLLIGHRLAVKAQSAIKKDIAGSSLEGLIPFVGARLSSWLHDEGFLQPSQAAQSVEESLCWLGAVSLRCNARSIGACSDDLRNAVGRMFRDLHTKWSSELSVDQKQNAAKSSLYRFKGVEDEEDLSQAAVDELFPTSNESTKNESSQQRIQDQAFVIARLHASIYGTRHIEDEAAYSLLRRWTDINTPDPFEEASSHKLPASLLSLDEFDRSLASIEPGRDYDMYADSNISEVDKLSDLLTLIMQRFERIQRAWPEHATPQEVNEHCIQILAISHAAPLPSFFQPVEKLHASITEWQKIASREVSAAELYEKLTTMIINWRQLELSAWNGLFLREWKQCEKAASSWWFVAYETIIAATDDVHTSLVETQKHSEGLLRNLSSFMSASGLGEYSARLQLLRAFRSELAVADLNGSDSRPVHSALSNFMFYYEQFEEHVAEALLKGRTKLEQDAKNTIQVASWKDRNIDVLRQSAQSSHRKLLRLVRKYRALLAQPVSQIIQGGVSELAVDASVEGEQHLSATTQATERIPISNIGIQLWDDRAERFRNTAATARLMSDKMTSVTATLNSTSQLIMFLMQLSGDIKSLQKATPSILNEDNKRLVNHLKTRKRRLFADVLKEVRTMGFQTALSVRTLSGQADLDRTLAGLPSMPPTHATDVPKATKHAMYRFIDMMTTARASSRNHSDDLTPAEVSRSISLLESMLQHSIAQYRYLVSHVSANNDLEALVQQWSRFTSCEGPQQVQLPRVEAMRESLAAFLPMIDMCVKTAEAQMRMAGSEYHELIETLEDVKAKAGQLHTEATALPTLPAGIESMASHEVSRQWNELQDRLKDNLEVAANQRPEFQPTIAQLLCWIGPKLQEDSKGIVNGKSHLDKTIWIRDLLNVLDLMLAGIQDASKLDTSNDNDKAWVVTEQALLNRTSASLRVSTVVRDLGKVLTQIQLLNGCDDLVAIVNVCRCLSPVVETYYQHAVKTLDLQSSAHAQVTKTAYALATSFTQLCQKGFCTPSEKPNDQDASAGDVESGTGLGDGEGGEDISKDIAPDEDLSELAQGAKPEEEGDEMQEEKDAVDMADEDLEGETGDASKAQEDKDGDGDASGQEDDAAELDEEPGEVDDAGPSAVDEKMWDGGQDESQRDMETDGAKGKADDVDTAADKDQGRESGEQQDEEDETGAEAGAEESEEVRQEAAEKVDPHARDEDNLDLPEDIDMDGQKGAESDTSDIDSMTDDAQGDAGEQPHDTFDQDMDEAEQDEQDLDPEQVQDGTAETDENDDKVAEDADDANEDAASDVLMQDHEQQQAKVDPQTNALAPPEAGTGVGQAEKEEQEAGAGTLTGGPSEKQQENETEDIEENAAGQKDDGQEGADQEAVSEERNPFKQIGDALEEWYEQNSKIERAQRQEPTETDTQHDEQPSNTRFQHLPDADTEADAQALGTASAEDSKALDRDQAIPVDDRKEDTELPFQDLSDEGSHDDEGNEAESMQIEPSDTLDQQQRSNAFIGEITKDDVHMADELDNTSDEDVQDVDEQLLHAHISNEEAVDELEIDDARRAWSLHEESTRNLALTLTEHLRLILQPTQATKMRGDFRTGKRLNIKRIIPYIASSYKRDKIWMRRSVPSKRAYQVMLAVDDSKSMMESGSHDLAFETLAMVTKSLSMLEVGELSVVGFGEDVKIAHSFEMPFTSESGAEIFKRLTFAQSKTNIRKLLAESIEMFRAARLKASSSASDLWQLQLIVSDGICEDHPSIRQLVRQAQEERIMIVFVVVDAATKNDKMAGSAKQSILDLHTAEFAKDAAGEMQLKMIKYLDTFPFGYYLIVRDVQELPGVLAGALRQWFAEVVETAA